jgi:uncharacterized LabA/DUF88 family protein
MRTNVYVDGFNLYYGCLKGTAYRWLDLGALCRRLLPNDEINRIRYFTALVTFRPDNPQERERQLTYLRALHTIPNLTVQLGHYLSRPVRMRLANPPLGGPATVEVIRSEEKGSDVNLATHLLLDAFKHDCKAAVVISNDSDLKEPVEVAQSALGLTVGVINPHPPQFRSRALRPTFFKQIRPATLRGCQFPPVLADAHGRIHKPAEW